MKPIAVVLAAGESRRMGLTKALLDAGGETFLGRLARSFAAAGCGVLVVTGADSARIRAVERLADLAFVENGKWPDGQLSSVRVGLQAALDSGGDPVLVHPVDVPRVLPETIRRLMDGLGASDAVLPVQGGEPGHPLVLSAAAARRVLGWSDAPHLEAALQRLNVRRLPVEDAGTIEEADTPAQYERLFKHPPSLA